MPGTRHYDNPPPINIGWIVGILTILGMLVGAILGVAKIGQAIGAHEQHDADMEQRLEHVEQALGDTAPATAWKYHVRGSVAAPSLGSSYTAADSSAPILPTKER